MSATSISISLTPLPLKVENDIGRKLFGRYFKPEEFRGYFKYLAQETRELGFPKQAPQKQQLANIAIKTHEEILELVEVLRQNTSSTRKTVRDILDTKFPGNPMAGVDREMSINRAIDISIRRWLMINTRERKFETVSEGSCVLWSDSMSLRDCIEGLFPRATWTPSPRKGRISPHFNAASMVNICDLKIKWTTYLERHLYLNRGKKILWVFPFKCWLQTLLAGQNDIDAADGKLIPGSLLKETIKTLDLLFPAWDPETQKLLKREGQDFHELEPIAENRFLNFGEYDHWRNRLLDVHDEIYISAPASWGQLWKDRRNPQQFWTFWFAIMILVLTLISTGATLAQTWASFQGIKQRS